MCSACRLVYYYYFWANIPVICVFYIFFLIIVIIIILIIYILIGLYPRTCVTIFVSHFQVFGFSLGIRS